MLSKEEQRMSDWEKQITPLSTEMPLDNLEARLRHIMVRVANQYNLKDFKLELDKE